eukprot:42593-Prorocentrum_minimum.AAC.1
MLRLRTSPACARDNGRRDTRILSPLARLVPVTGIFSLYPFAIGARDGVQGGRGVPAWLLTGGFWGRSHRTEPAAVGLPVISPNELCSPKGSCCENALLQINGVQVNVVAILLICAVLGFTAFIPFAWTFKPHNSSLFADTMLNFANKGTRMSRMKGQTVVALTSHVVKCSARYLGSSVNKRLWFVLWSRAQRGQHSHIRTAATEFNSERDA